MCHRVYLLYFRNTDSFYKYYYILAGAFLLLIKSEYKQITYNSILLVFFIKCSRDKLFIFFFCFVISCNHKINTTYSALHQIWIKVGTHKNWVASSTPTHPQANKAFCSCYALATEIFH